MKRKHVYTDWDDTPLTFHYFATYFSIPFNVLSFLVLILSPLYTHNGASILYIAASLGLLVGAFYCLLKRQWLGPTLLVAQRLFTVAFDIFVILLLSSKNTSYDIGPILIETLPVLIWALIIFIYYRKRRLLFSPLPEWYTPPRKADGPWTPPADWAAATWKPPSDWAAAQNFKTQASPSQAPASPVQQQTVVPESAPDNAPRQSETIPEHKGGRKEPPMEQLKKHKVKVQVISSHLEQAATEDSPKAPEKQVRKKFASSKALPLLLGIVCLIFAASTTVLAILFFDTSKQLETANQTIASQEESLKEKEDEIVQLNLQVNSKDSSLKGATDRWKAAQDDVASLRKYEYFVAWRLGFIIKEDDFYHNFDCEKVKRADSYFALDVGYCDSIGLEYCPLCWPDEGPSFLKFKKG